MPAPTERHVQDQRSDASGVSDARKRIDAYVARRAQSTRHFDEIHWFTLLGVPVETLRLSDIQSVLADADRDRQFAEAVRANIVNHRMCFALQSCAEMAQSLDRVHADVYGTPCTAREKV